MNVHQIYVQPIDTVVLHCEAAGTRHGRDADDGLGAVVNEREKEVKAVGRMRKQGA
jgi:hypothetical protein